MIHVSFSYVLWTFHMHYETLSNLILEKSLSLIISIRPNINTPELPIPDAHSHSSSQRSTSPWRGEDYYRGKSRYAMRPSSSEPWQIPRGARHFLIWSHTRLFMPLFGTPSVPFRMIGCQKRATDDCCTVDAVSCIFFLLYLLPCPTFSPRSSFCC